MSGVWLLLGPEEGEKTQFIDQIIKRITRESGGAPELHRVYPYDSSVVDIVALLRNGSLFASHRAVIFSGVHDVKAANDVTVLAEYCGTPSQEATLFLVSSQLSGRVAAALVRAVPKDRQKIFWEMFENRKVEWVHSFFRKKNIEIDRDASQFITEMVEGNTRDLEQECGRLALFFSSSAVDGEVPGLHLEQVERYLYHSKEENVFTLFDRVARRDGAGAQEVLDKILLSHQADPVQLLGGLLWQVRVLHQIKALVEEGYAPTEACARLKVRGKRQQRIYIEALRLYSLAETEGMILQIADADRLIRTTRSELHRVVLQLFLLKTVRGTRSVRAPAGEPPRVRAPR